MPTLWKRVGRKTFAWSIVEKFCGPLAFILCPRVKHAVHVWDLKSRIASKARRPQNESDKHKFRQATQLSGCQISIHPSIGEERRLRKGEAKRSTWAFNANSWDL
jgi:hypothetical protein